MIRGVNETPARFLEKPQFSDIFLIIVAACAYMASAVAPAFLFPEKAVKNVGNTG